MSLLFRLGRRAVVSTLLVACSAVAHAADFPSRAVNIVVPFPPGGATDLTARIVAQGLSQKWGQSVVVSNKPGAGGNVGSEFVARSEPNGYTIVLGVTGSHGINTSLYSKMSYEPLKDFQPVTLATLYPNAIVVNPDVPASNLQDLLKLLKANSNKYVYGSDGNGTASHLGMELLRERAGVEITHVPYRGSTPMITDLMSGQIQVGITGLPAVLPHIKAGRLKLIAITTGQRFPSTPDLPTVAEQGFGGYAAAPWSGFFVPAGTPAEIVKKISADMRDVMNDPDLRQKIADAGSVFTPSTPEEFHQFVSDEIKKWADAVKISGARVD